MGSAEQLANHVVQLQYDDLPQEVIEHCKNEIIDVLGCMIAANEEPGIGIILDLLRQYGGREDATVAVHGGKLPVESTAMINGTMARALDYEVCGPRRLDVPTLVLVKQHTAASTVPVALAVAEWVGSVSGKDLITALALGDDIGGRVGAASNPDPFGSTGWDYDGLSVPFGASAVAAKLMKLNTHQIVNAFGIVLEQAAGTLQSIIDGTLCARLVNGLAARVGIFSAELAEKGFTGSINAFESKFGYFHLYSREHDASYLTSSLGETFYSDVLFKLYPCCAANHPSLDALLGLLKDHPVRSEDVDIITARVHPSLVTLLGWPFELGANPVVNAQFNLHYTLADTLIRGRPTLEHFTLEAVTAPEVQQEIKKVHVVPLVPVPEEQRFYTAEVEVKLKNSQKFCRTVEDAKGFPFNPASVEDIEAKYRANVLFPRLKLASANTERLLILVRQLEQLTNVAEIVRLLEV